jgi:hypothetical protein
MTAMEVLFNQAEAAARGWTSGNAESLFKAAIAVRDGTMLDGTATWLPLRMMLATN